MGAGAPRVSSVSRLQPKEPAYRRTARDHRAERHGVLVSGAPAENVTERRSSLLDAVSGCHRTFSDQRSALGRRSVLARCALSRVSWGQLYEIFDHLRFTRAFRPIRAMHPGDGARVCCDLVLEVGRAYL